MRVRTIRVIIDQTYRGKIKTLIKNVAQDQQFQVLVATASLGLGIFGSYATIFIDDGMADKLDSLLNSVNKSDQKLDELSNRLIDALKSNGAISEDSKIETDVLESVTDNDSLKEEIHKLKQTVHTHQMLLGVAIVIVAFLLRPSSAVEMLEKLTNDN